MYVVEILEKVYIGNGEWDVRAESLRFHTLKVARELVAEEKRYNKNLVSIDLFEVKD